MNQNTQFPTAAFGAMSLFFGLYILMMIVVAVTVLVALWRAMRAHEQIAAQMANVAEALRSSKG
jgi:uncharacterized membrane protein